MRVQRTGASGRVPKEGISINLGLLALGNVIPVLADMAAQHGSTDHAHAL